MKAFNPEKELKRLNRKFGKRNLIIGIFAILISLTIGSSYAIFSITKQSHVILSGKVGEFTTNDIQLAVLVEGEKTDKFPEKGSGYIFDSLICDNGTTGTWDSNSWNIKIYFKGPDKCVVNFAKQPTAAKYIESLLANNLTSMNNIDPDGNVRYMGENPNNFVYFNDELWRIIGVFDGKIKIIRNTKLPVVLEDNGVKIGDTSNYITATTNYFYWDSNGINNWSNATLKNYLNGTYYNSINDNYRNLISNAKWYLGGFSDSNYRTLSFNDVYKSERSNNVYNGNDLSVDAFIGLAYPSDYLYSTNSEEITCMNDYFMDYFSFMSSYGGYTISINLNYSNYVVVFMSGGADFQFYSEPVNYTGYSYAKYDEPDVYPTLYLNSDVYFMSGDGSKDNPYQLAI